MKKTFLLFAITFIALSSCSSLLSQSAQQVGSDIDGEAAEDHSGASVSLSADGNRLAIGAPQNDDSGKDAGHVRVYEWAGGAWVQMGQDIDGEGEDDRSGFSVSLSSDGNRVAIGAYKNDDTGIGSNAGHVRVYDWNGSIWVQIGQDIDGESVTDYSGWSISLSSDGNRVAIGARINGGNGAASGHVRVYDWDGSIWEQAGDDIDGEQAHDQSGWSVALSANGTRLAIGAPHNNGNGLLLGHVRIFDWDGINWTQVGDDIDGEANGDRSGNSVSLSADGSRVAIGAPNNGWPDSGKGHVRIFDWDGNNWVLTGADIDGESAADESGVSVALSSDGNRVAIGAIYNYGSSNNSGHVRVYDWDGTDWIQACDDIDGEADFDFSGFSVALSSDGSRIAIGAVGNNENGFRAGSVRVYEDCLISQTIEQKPISIFKTYPNPTIGKIDLIGVDNGSIKIIDSFGNIMLIEKEFTSKLDISYFPTGVYFIIINSNDQKVFEKVFKF